MNPGDEVWVKAEVVHAQNSDEVRVAIKDGEGTTDDKVYARTEDVKPVHTPQRALRIGDQVLVAARLLDVGKTDVKVRTVGTHGEDEGWVKNASVFHTDGTPVQWGVQCTSLIEKADHIFRCQVYVNPANPLHNHRRGDLTWTTDEEAGTLVKTK